MPTGVLPISLPQCDSLHRALARVPDPRTGRNKSFRIGQVLTIVAMAFLAGRREIAAIECFGKSLTQPLRRPLGLPEKRDKAFRRVPSYAVYYGLLAQIGPGVFNKVLNQWLEALVVFIGARAGPTTKGATITGRPCSSAYRFLGASWRLQVFPARVEFSANAPIPLQPWLQLWAAPPDSVLHLRKR